MTEKLIPIFHVKDAQPTAKWYTRMGFEVEGKHRFAPGFPLYIFQRRGNNALYLSEHKGDARSGTLVYFYVEGMDAIAAEFGVDLVEQPWTREIQLINPDGNRWRISQGRGRDGYTEI